MTLLEFAESININLLPYQKGLIEAYAKARREGNVINVILPPKNGKTFFKDFIDEYVKYLKKDEEMEKMIILQSGRCGGKTSELIRQANATGAGILTYTSSMAMSIKAQARAMGFKDINVFSFNEIENIKRNNRIRKIYIDELPMFLEQLIGFQICLATGDIECLPLKRGERW